MKKSPNNEWLQGWMALKGVPLWGVADIRVLCFSIGADQEPYPGAISWAIPMSPDIMAGLKNGPTRAYARAYSEVNVQINALAPALAKAITQKKFRAYPLAASDRTDQVNIRGDFPHKTAATLSGVGWVGRHCQLVTRQFGPWVRLGTVFTDMPMVYGTPFNRGYCGTCRACVDACPAGALTGKTWQPGIKRKEILDAIACDRWKKEHYIQFNNGHNCGICSSVCPYGLKHWNNP
ncbi:MAG: 4Fe-4S double cluster binding domain-containing protein [Desulfobacterales bacterium]|nr:4Fe-4S double cluster binding domain-containing protein [Desulfobacterales bacterium]MDX2511685.1 4Fe-4S double cluster binding domain-containing protein [Desulfobacterales bacterium]